jgi:translation elongation factor EF-G
MTSGRANFTMEFDHYEHGAAEHLEKEIQKKFA